MPSLLSKTFQAVGVTAFASVAGFTVWTKHAHFSTPAQFNPSTDPLFQSEWVKKFNPANHEATYDECVRRIGLQKIKPEILEDAKKGGSKLVEEFVRGVWGGPGYTVQRLYLQNKYRNDTTTAHQLWTTQQLKTSDYAPSTEITDHFVVLAKSPTSILIRCGDSPLKSPDSPRSSDGLFEMCAVANLDEGYAEFRLKSIFYVGDENWAGGKILGETTGQSGEGGGKEVVQKASETWENKGPMQGSMWYAHKLYTKLWMECGLSRVKS